MLTFKQLYDKTVSKALGQEGGEASYEEDYDPYHLDCLLNPEKHPLVYSIGTCDCDPQRQSECIARCPFGAIQKGDEGIEIVEDLCLGCEKCVDGCASERLRSTTDIIPALKAIRSSEQLVYAMIAPAFLGQWEGNVTPGQLRNAFRKVGFDGMLEVALFADILTMKEALDFDKNISDIHDFQLTSCCCPMWIGMIRKVYHQLVPHVPGSVSPMIACARVIKALHPNALTVFIGPCLAKKAEAREKDLVGDVDYVLTFQEMDAIFESLGISPKEMEDTEKEHSSRAGRIYAVKGGVSEAVASTLQAIAPQRQIGIVTQQADGVPACKKMIQDILDGNITANFYEGMGCVGGCVGGPRAIVPKEVSHEAVSVYGSEATYQNPAENPYVVELLDQLGLHSVEMLLEETELFSRHIT